MNEISKEKYILIQMIKAVLHNELMADIQQEDIDYAELFNIARKHSVANTIALTLNLLFEKMINYRQCYMCIGGIDKDTDAKHSQKEI